LVTKKDDPHYIGAVTSGHVFTRGEFRTVSVGAGMAGKPPAFVQPDLQGVLDVHVMRSDQDLAVVQLTKDTLGATAPFPPEPYHPVSINDVLGSTEVRVRTDDKHSTPAFILDQGVSYEVQYRSMKKLMRGVIIIGSTPDRRSSRTVSSGGNSGSCVVHATTGRIIGMLLGGSSKFSFVLPIQNTLEMNGLKPI